jgi:hypothetical protein
MPAPVPVEPTIAAPAVQPEAPSSGMAHAQQIAESVRRSDVVTQCWTRAMRANPTHAAEQIQLTLDVQSDGHATSHVAGARDASFGHCVETRVNARRFDPGETVTVQLSFNLTAS